MKSKHDTTVPARHFAMKMAIASLFVIVLSMQAFAQSTTSQTIRGIVKSTEDNQPIPGTNIYLKSLSSVGTFSDSQGQFEFPRALKTGDVLVFSFIGLKTTEYLVTDQPAGFVVIAMPDDPIQMVDEIIVEGAEPASQSGSAKRLRKIKANH